MSLPVDADSLRGEIQENEEFRKRFLGPNYEERIQRYAGPGYRQGVNNIDFNNFAYKWISLFLPMMASGAPRARMTTPRRGTPQIYARATELAQNRNMYYSKLKEQIELLAVDWAFKFCVAHTGTEIRPGYRSDPDPPYWPITRRVSPTRYVADWAFAYQTREMQFQALKLTRYKNRILAEAEADPNLGWNTAMVASLAEDTFRDQRKDRTRYSGTLRREVEFYEIWVPDHVLDVAYDEDGNEFVPTEAEGYHGTIFTVATDGDAVERRSKRGESSYLREPRPFWGPRSGMFTFGGYLPVPDEVVPLAPIAATEALNTELNDHRRAISAAIRSYAAFIGISGGNEDIADKIRDVEDLEVAIFEGIPPGQLKDYVQEMRKGGITKEHLVHLDLLERGLDQSAGMTESQQGEPSSGVTATAEAIANQSSGRRMGYMTEKFQQGVIQEIIEKETWYTINDPSYREHLGPEAYGLFIDPQTGEPAEEVVYEGGGNNARMLDEMDIRIEPLSTRFSSEALQAERAARRREFLMNIAPILPQIAGFVDVEQWLDAEAEWMNDPSMRSLILYPELRKAAALATGGMLQGQGPRAQPRLQNDVRTGLKTSEQPYGFSNNARPQNGKAPREIGSAGTSKVNGDSVK